MKRFLTSAVLSVFVAGMVVYPLLHKLSLGHNAQTTTHSLHSVHDADQHGDAASHDAAHCHVCQLAAAPLLTSLADYAPVTIELVGRPLSVPGEWSPVTIPHKLPFSCGPPA